jgi:peptidoglycan/xylan/chitin deacetylase (PgdA/CDA1 family)
VTTSLCMTVDVEDFYEGMSVLGHEVPRRGLDPAGGLGTLLDQLGAMDVRPAVTLFVVGHYADRIRSPLEEFVAAGHEIASHGPDHGRLPVEGTVTWLRKGREMLEDLLGLSVTGFRSPRFDVPEGMGLARFRDALAEAGYEYVSDASCLGEASPLRELPVLSWRGVHVGGGSYQRLMPTAAVTRAVSHNPGPAVLYYHSYDFDGTLPGVRDVRSAALAKQVLGRRRIATIFQNLTRRFGSETCRHAAR